MEAREYISNIIDMAMRIATNRGESISDIPFTNAADGFVYDDAIIRIAVSVGAEYVEIYRKVTETIVFDLANAVLRKYSPEIDLLIPHFEQLLTEIQ